MHLWKMLLLDMMGLFYSEFNAIRQKLYLIEDE